MPAPGLVRPIGSLAAMALRLRSIGSVLPFAAGALLAACYPQVRAQDAAPGVVEGQIICAGLTRTWVGYVSARFSPAHTRPLLLVLHGGGSRGQGMRTLTRHRFEELADRDDGIVIYPDGIAGNWDDDRVGVDDRAHRDHIDDVGFITALIAELSPRYHIDPARISVTGMSNGAIMSYRLAREVPGTFSLVAPVCGLLTQGGEDKPWPRPCPVLLITSDDDPIVPSAGGAVAVGHRERGEVDSYEQTLSFLLAQDHAVLQPTGGRRAR